MSHCKKEMISFYLTTRCNLSCAYCYTNKNTVQHKDQILDFEFAKRGIDDYYNTKYKRHIRFFGAGEPTEEFGLMQDIYRYAKNKDKSTTAEIQTNGCFSDEIAVWLGKHIDIVWISSDGTPDIQDYFRPLNGGDKTSHLIEKNIKKILDFGKSVVGIRATITKDNYNRQIEIIRYFRNLGIKNFWVDPVFPSIGEAANYNQCPFDMGKFAEMFIEAAKYAYSRDMTYGSILTCNFDEPGDISCRSLLPVPHLTTDGYVSACDMALFGNDKSHMDVFIYGHWDKKNNCIVYSEDKIARLRSRSYQNIDVCANCSIAPYCRGYCPGEVVNETGDIFGCKTIICKPVKTMFNSLTDNEKQYLYTHP